MEEELKDAVQDQTDSPMKQPQQAVEATSVITPTPAPTSSAADNAEPSTSSATSPTVEEKAADGGGWGLWGWVESAKSKVSSCLSHQL